MPFFNLSGCDPDKSVVPIPMRTILSLRSLIILDFGKQITFTI